MSLKLTLSTLFFSLLFLTACGGGSSTPSTAPTAVITAEDELAEGTTSTPLDASNSSDSNGDVTTYLWAIENSNDIAGLSLSDSSLVTPELTGIPPSISGDINIIVSLIVTDNDGEESEKVTKTITVVESNPVTFDTSNFNGTWYSPCFNSSNNTSIEQTLIISGTSMTSEMDVYSAGPVAAFNCVLPGTSTGLIEATGTTRLSFGGLVSRSGCINGEAINTSINISNIQVGSASNTSTSQINGVLALLAPNVDVLPVSTEMCILSNGNLLYAGSQYTSSRSIIVPPDISWKVGTNVYTGATANGANAGILD